MQKYFSDKQIGERYGVHRVVIWSWVRKGIFPKPVKLSPGCTRWAIEDIEQYEKALREG